MKLLLILFSLTFSVVLYSQQTKLKSGYDNEEYIEMIKISAWQLDSMYNPNFPKPDNFTLDYRSKPIGLDNRYDIWISKDSIAVISIRQTTSKQQSLLQNAYAVMVAAQGKLHLSNDFVFDYNLSDDTTAAVHLGWLIGMSYVHKDLLEQLNIYQAKGIKDYLIVGHSLGGAIAYLLRSQLESDMRNGVLSKNLTFKTYCSAAPKPGNLPYAYSFENLTKNGWAYNVINSADWAPEAPFTVQQTTDINFTNPFRYAQHSKKTLKFKDRFLMNYLSKKVSKPTRKATKKYKKLFGKMIGKYIDDYLPQFIVPEIVNSMNYVRTGNSIVLYADDDYFKIFKETPDNMWTHHSFESYLYLAKKW